MSQQDVPIKDALKSYLYLRVGLIGAAIFLAASIVIEIFEVWGIKNDFCLQPSISAYYYTPVRAVFVGSLLIVSISLIVIQGDRLEDAFLTFAGMMAPVVALVPTQNTDASCSSWPAPSPTAADSIIVDNNIRALLIVGAVAWIAAGFLLWTQRKTAPRSAKAGWLVVGVILLVFGLWFGPGRESFNDNAHNWTAIALFVFLFFATLRSARRSQKQLYMVAYSVLAALMVLVALVVLVGVTTTSWGHGVFTLEATEISIFATYWIFQTFDNRPPPIASLTKPTAETSTDGVVRGLWREYKSRSG